MLFVYCPFILKSFKNPQRALVNGQPYYERQKSQGQRRVGVAGEAAREPGGREKPVGGGGGLAQVRVKQQEGRSPQSCTETDFEMKTSNFVLFFLILVVSVHFRAIYDETIRCQA